MKELTGVAIQLVLLPPMFLLSVVYTLLGFLLQVGCNVWSWSESLTTKNKSEKNEKE